MLAQTVLWHEDLPCDIIAIPNRKNMILGMQLIKMLVSANKTAYFIIIKKTNTCVYIASDI